MKKIEIERVREYEGYDAKTDSIYPHWYVWISVETGAVKHIPFEDRDELDRFINAGEYTERVKEWLDGLHMRWPYTSEPYEAGAEEMTYVITKKQA